MIAGRTCTPSAAGSTRTRRQSRCRILKGKTAVPCASLTMLMLGPGTTIAHAAVKTLAENGCTILWAGEGGVRLYAQGMGESRWAPPAAAPGAAVRANSLLRLKVVRRMYERRFPGPLDPALTLHGIRGKEGVRVREAYARASRETGVEWSGREYKRDDWKWADPINRALWAANSCLYGVCHAAILSAGYSPGLGFVHTGKLLSFLYDIADLYKAESPFRPRFRLLRMAKKAWRGACGAVCATALRQSGCSRGW